MNICLPFLCSRQPGIPEQSFFKKEKHIWKKHPCLEALTLTLHASWCHYTNDMNYVIKCLCSYKVTQFVFFLWWFMTCSVTSLSPHPTSILPRKEIQLEIVNALLSLQVTKGLGHGCILFPYLFNVYVEYIVRADGMEWYEHGFKIGDQ